MADDKHSENDKESGQGKRLSLWDAHQHFKQYKELKMKTIQILKQQNGFPKEAEPLVNQMIPIYLI